MNQRTTSYSKLSGWIDQVTGLGHSLARGVRRAQPSQRPGMGAIPFDGGTTFRVWAPHADQIAVAGSFNRWSRRTRLAREGNGYWSADVSAARPGHEYKFLIRRGRHAWLRSDPYARAVGRVQGNSVISQAPFDWGEESFTAPRLAELVIYELHVGTFASGPDGRPGDFAGVVARLPYLRALGINAIELMPVAAFPGDYSWGYNPAHPFAISPVYGGGDGLRQLVRAAHEAGIAVIVDVVYNHFGPDALDLWQFDGWQENGGGGIYFYNDWRASTPWGDTRPDYGRPQVRQYLRDNALMWFEEYHVDGLRFDATSYIRTVHGHDGDSGSAIAEGWHLMKWINDEISGRYPQAIRIAEDLQANGWLTRETAGGGAGFDAQWDSHFVHPLRQALIAASDEQRDMNAVAEAIAFRYNDNAFDRVIYTESHDEVANGKARVPEEIAPGAAASPYARQRSALGAAITLTAPGIPMLFQGQEFLADGWFDDRRPIDWARAGRYAGLVGLYRDLIRLRLNESGTTAGLAGPHVHVYHVDDEAKSLAYHRWEQGGPGDDVVVVANFGHRPLLGLKLGLPLGGRWRLRFASDHARYGTDDVQPGAGAGRRPAATITAAAGERDGLPYEGAVDIGGYALLVYSQEKT